MAKMNHYDKYLGQTLFNSNVTDWSHYRQTHQTNYSSWATKVVLNDELTNAIN